MSSTNECSICLQTIDLRGGVPLAIPGCCGNMFHQSCINKVTAGGDHACPLCRAPLPSAMIQAARTPQNQGIFGGLRSIGGSIFGGGSPNPIPQPNIQHNLFSPTRNSSFNRSGRTRENDITKFPDEPITVRGAASSSSVVAAASSSPEDTAGKLSVTHSLEYDNIPVTVIDKFHTSIGLKFLEPVAAEGTSRSPLDVVCILDTSGSMAGEKIAELKKAMKFVVGTLNEFDRLAIIDFNSNSAIVQGFKRMTDTNKHSSGENIDNLNAGGGTDIFSGLDLGSRLLEARTNKNPTSCMFLLTDGQDGDRLQQKIAIAKALKASGSSLFVFGFGADHDANHLTTIANAAEGSFMYIETSDTVIDAFGGAIGSQLSGMIYNVKATIAVQPGSDNTIKAVHAGSYPVLTRVAGKSYEITFSSMFAGEFRDILVEMSLPASPDTSAYVLFDTSASYEVNSGVGAVVRETVHLPPKCNTVGRSSAVTSLKLENRNIDMDFKIQRVEATNAMKRALELAEQGRNTDAKKVLQTAKESCMLSPSHAWRDVKMDSLLADVDHVMANTDRDVYAAGGRANMMESCSSNMMQRQVYKKSSASPSLYQNSSSTMMQNRANSSKSTLGSKKDSP